MKHTLKITWIILGMFFLTQLIGLAVINAYSPETTPVTLETGEIVNITSYNLPFGLDPPQEIDPGISLISIVIAIVFAVLIILLLMKIDAALFLRLWFFFVITLALAIAINSALLGFKNSAIIALAIALPLAVLKIFRRNIIIHNMTELLIYPGIAVIFVPLLSVWTVVLLLILISIYDIYAVWHAGFMQKMAKYHMNKLKLFPGFFVPYLGKKQKSQIAKLKKSRLKNKKIRINVVILGGGDVVFPMILAGVVFLALGFIQALLISIGATLALAYLLYKSEKGKFYPAMPFITIGCFIALAVAYLIS